MNLVDNLSDKCVSFISKNLEKDDEELEKLQYGIKVILINLTKFIVLFATAYYLNVLKYTFIAFMVFGFLRTFSCGVHAESSIVCIIINYITFLGNVYFSLNVSMHKGMLLFIFIISLILICKYSPADTESRPLVSKKLRRKLKTRSIIVVLIATAFCIIIPSGVYTNIIAISILEEAFFITPIAYTLFNKKYKNYENVTI